MLAGVLSILLLVVLSLLGHLAPVRQYLLQYGSDYLRASRQIRLESSGLDYNLFRLSATLRDVRLGAPSAGDAPDFLTAESIELRLRLRDLLRGRLTIRQARLRGLGLSIVVDGRGRSNLPFPGPPSTPRSPPDPGIPLLVEDLTAEGIRLSFQDPSRALSLPGGSLTVRGEGPSRTHELRFRSGGPGTLSLEGEDLPVGSVRVELQLRPERILVRSAGASLGESQLALRGEITGLEEPRFGLEVSAALELGQLAPLVGLELPIQGSVEAQASIREGVGDLRVEAEIAGRGLGVDGIEIARLEANPILWERASGRVAVDGLRVESRAGNLTGEVEFRPGQQSQARIRFQDLDLRPLAPRLEWPLEIASRASGEVSGEWRELDLSGLRASGRLRLAPTDRSTAPGRLPLDGVLDLELDGGRLALDLQPLEGLGLRLQGKGSLETDSRISARLDGDVPDLAVTVASLQSLLPGWLPASLAEAEPGGPAAISVQLAGTRDQPEVTARLVSPGLRTSLFPQVEVSADLRYRDQLLEISNLRMVDGEQQVSGEGSISLGSPDPGLDLVLTGRDLSLETALGFLPEAPPIGAKAGLVVRVTGSLSRPAVDLSGSFRKLVAYGEPLGSLELTAGFSDQRLELTRFQLEKPGPHGEAGELKGTASLDLAAGLYSVSARGSGLRLVAPALREMVPLEGSFDLVADGAGSLTDPLLEVRMEAPDLAIGEQDLGGARISGRWREGEVLLEGALAALNLRATARVGTASPYPARVDLTAEGIALERLPLPAGMAGVVEGTLSGTLQGSGDLQEWREGRLEASIGDLRLVASGQEFRNRGPLALRLDRSRLEVARSILIGGENRLEVAGSLPFDQAGPPGELILQAGLDPAALIAFLPGGEAWKASGRLQAEATLGGSLSSLVPGLAVQLREGTVSVPGFPEPVTDIRIVARNREDVLLIEEAGASWSGTRIRGSGRLPLAMVAPAGIGFRDTQADQMAAFELRVEELGLASTGLLPEAVDGRADLVLQGRAPRPELGALDAELRFEELVLELPDWRGEQTEASRLTLREGILQVEQLRVRGPGTDLSVQGTTDLGDPVHLDLSAGGSVDLGVLSSIFSDLPVGGIAELQLGLSGDPGRPELSGRIELRNGRADLTSPPIQVEEVSLQLGFGAGKVTLQGLSGRINGGDLEGSGEILYSEDGLQRLDLRLDSQEVYLEFPPGLRTVSRGEIRVESVADRIQVGGEVKILAGSYRERVDLENQVLAYLRSRGSALPTAERDPHLSRVRFNVDIETVDPIRVDNNLARLAASSDLRLVGSYYRPSLVGRIALEEGGELSLSENRYVLETGRVEFLNENRIEPLLSLVGRTRAGGYDIQLTVAGNSQDLETSLSSEPPLPEADILSVLLTGRTLDEARGAEVNIAREQALSYLAGRVGGGLSRQAQEKLGVSRVRIEPNLIAPESDPSVRLTVGQDLRQDLRLIYSMNLADSGDQIYVTEYDLTRRFNTRAVKQSDNSYRFVFRHDLPFGGSFARTESTSRERRLGEIRITGTPVLAEPRLLSRLNLRSGQRFDFLQLQDRVERLRSLYREEGYLESSVRVRQARGPDRVDLEVVVDAGPRLEFSFEGMEVPDRVRGQVREAWLAGAIDIQRHQESLVSLRGWLIRSGYLASRVEADLGEAADGIRRVRFRIEPGSRYSRVEILFEGAGSVAVSRLRELVREEGGVPGLLLDPARLRDRLTGYYRGQGHPEVQVGEHRLELEEETSRARVILPFSEGPRYRFGTIRFQGNAALESTELAAAVALAAGQPYDPTAVEEGRGRIEELYWGRGFNQVEVAYAGTPVAATAELELVFRIQERRQEQVADVQIEGNRAVSEGFIRQRIQLAPGDILNYSQVNRSRRSLNRTGAFSFVDFEARPIGPAPGGEQQRMSLRARVREARPFQLRYGVFLDTDRGPGATLELENRNSLGSARVLGLRTRYDAEVREARGYFGQPVSWGVPGTLNVTGFRSREIFQRDFTSDFLTDRTGLSLQHELELAKNLFLNYGFRFERTHTFDREPDPFCPLPPDDPLCRFDESFDIAPLTASFSWDTRDELLDATSGLFTSHALELASSRLGSDLTFLKYFGQIFKYVPLTEPEEIPFSSGLRRPRVVYAGGLRVGLSRGFGGQSLIFSERFFAGGGTSVRGFNQDSLGPVDFLGDPAGGEALFIMNHELRFPLVSLLDGVGFVDLGNLYPTVRDFDPWNIRKSAGLGLRVRTPYFLLRMDYGFKLDRKAEESRGAFFFSIGQAF